MKNLQEQLQEEVGQVSEARNNPYYLALNTYGADGLPIGAILTLDNPRDAKFVDEWMKEEIGNTIVHAGGGPNNIEL